MTARRQERNDQRRGASVIAAVIVAVILVCTNNVLAATTERVVADRFTGLAIGGIDPVAYFTEGRMTAGRSNIEAAAAGVVWRFKNDSNRSFFLARPDIYAPQFGGYDPVDVARGVLCAGSPRLWLIAGQRLYLFGREQTRNAFAANPSAVLRKASRRWPRLEETLAR